VIGQWDGPRQPGGADLVGFAAQVVLALAIFKIV
jgi:hypothetical protein